MRSQRIPLFPAALVAGLVGLLLCAAPGWAAKAKPVKVVNGERNPVLIEDLDRPERQPFQRSLQIDNDTSDGGPAGGTLPTVPEGRRLVIEFLSASCSSTGSEPTKIRVTSNVDHFFSLVTVPFGSGFSSTATHPTRMYFEPGQVVEVAVFPTGNAPSIHCGVAMSGYYIDL